VFQIDLKSRKAIYEQIIDNFKSLITSGVLAENEKAPSIRDMAKTLTVNPNTIQKAYRELENQGYFYTVLGQGSFIAAAPEDENQIRHLYERLKEIVLELVFRGERADDITNFIENIENYKEAQNDKSGKNN
jgi:GntR family transcriptional regulator